MALVAVACASGCVRLASALPNQHGGWTLVTSADTMEEAAARFDRKAKMLCPIGARPAFTTPVVTGLRKNIAFETEMTCR